MEDNYPESDITAEQKAFTDGVEKLLLENRRQYAPKATARPDKPNLTVHGLPSYNSGRNEIYLESVGPAEDSPGTYTLVFDLDEQTLIHAYGPYDDQQFSSPVEDIDFPED